MTYRVTATQGNQRHTSEIKATCEQTLIALIGKPLASQGWRIVSIRRVK